MDDELFQSKYIEIHTMRLKNPQKTISVIQTILSEDLELEQRLKVELVYAYCLWLIPKSDQAYSKYNEILQQAKTIDKTELIADSLNGIATIHGETGDSDNAIIEFNEAINLYKKNGLQKKEAHALNRLAVIHYTMGDFEKAEELFHQVLNLGHDKVVEINARNNIALINMERGKITEAVSHFQWCTEQARSLGFDRAICSMQNNYAEALKMLGEYADAEKNYQNALEFARNTNDIRNQALLTASYAQFLIDLGELEKADELFRESISIHQSIKETYHHILVLNGYAKLWFTRGYYDEALSYLTEANELIEISGIKRPKIENLVTTAEINVILDQVENAYAYLKEAEKLAWELNSDEGKARILIERGRINIFNLNLDEAELLLLDAHRISVQCHNLKNRFKALTLLANVYLLKYQSNSENNNYYQQAMKQILEVNQIAEEKKLIPDYIDSCILQAMLKSVVGDYDEAEKILSEARALAQEKGMENQVKHAYQRLILVSRNISQKESNLDIEHGEITLMATIEDIQKIIGNLPVPTLTLSDLDKIFLLTYKVDDIFGPQLLNSFNVNLSDERYKKQIDIVGSLYIVSLGHGTEYHHGLFGPFPFGTTRLNSLVFSKMLIDSNPEDPSDMLGNEVYFLLCLVYPKKISPYLYNRQKLEVFIEKYLENVKHVKDVNSHLLGNFYMDIMETFFKKLLKT